LQFHCNSRDWTLGLAHAQRLAEFAGIAGAVARRREGDDLPAQVAPGASNENVALPLLSDSAATG
jgi:hypothetical protein